MSRGQIWQRSEKMIISKIFRGKITILRQWLQSESKQEPVRDVKIFSNKSNERLPPGDDYLDTFVMMVTI